MTYKNKNKLLSIILTILMVFMTACSSDNNTVQNNAVNAGSVNEDVSDKEASAGNAVKYVEYEYSSEDTDASIDSGACNIILNSASASILGSGAEVSGSIITIKKAGTYMISGTLDDGQIIVDAGGKDTVKLVFNGVTIHNSSTSPIYAKNAEKTIIILNDNTMNTITDSDSYIFDAEEDEPNAAIFSKDDLTITGSGTLNVTGSYYNGIGCKDILCITGGNIIVTAVNDGLRGRDGIAAAAGSFIINAGNDGMKANNDADAEKGYIVIDGGSFDITAACDAIQAETALTINGGTYAIKTGGGSASAPVKQEDFRGFRTAAASTEDSDSKKGLKAGTQITISGGIFTIDSEDDAVHANSEVLIEGGSFNITAGDDGMHADGTLTINDGGIIISKSYEGLEGSIVIINGGNIDIVSSDDGINAAGGSDSSSMMGPMGRDSFSSSGSYYIEINGGTVKVDGSGDGIDSNGNLYINGGSVFVNGSSDNSNAALDGDGIIEINGGIVMAAGSSGMAEAPSSSSGQPCIFVAYSSVQEAGSTIIFKDSNGNILVEFTPVRRYHSVIFSSPELVLDNTYSLYSGNSKLTDIKISSTVTAISDSGESISGGAGGFGGMGGGKTRPDGSMNNGKPNRGTMPDGTVLPEGAQPFGDRTMPEGMQPPADGTVPDKSTEGSSNTL